MDLDDINAISIGLLLGKICFFQSMEKMVKMWAKMQDLDLAEDLILL